MYTDLDALKKSTDLRVYYGEKMRCPYHNDTIPSLVIYPDHVHCFGCGITKDSLSFIQDMEGVSFGQAIYILKKIIGKQYQESLNKINKSYEAKSPMSLEDEELIQKYKTDLQNSLTALDYLRNRGIHQKGLLATLKIGWTGRAISIPYYMNNKLWNVKYRIHPDYRMDNEPKYMGHSRPYPCLWPHDYIMKTKEKRKVLCLTEGELDTLLLLQYGIPSVSLPSGASSVSSLLKYRSLLSKWDKVWVIFDQDKAGEKAREVMEKPCKAYYGKSIVDMLGAEIEFVSWNQRRGKDVTEARDFVIPKLKEILNE